MEYEIEIVERPAFDVAALERRFVPDRCQEEIPAFWSEYHRAGWSEKVCGRFGICYGCDGTTFAYAIGDMLADGLTVPAGYRRLEIPASRWAIFRCVGPLPKSIQDASGYLHEEWKPEPEYEVDSHHLIEEYTYGDIQSPDYTCFLWVALKKTGE